VRSAEFWTWYDDFAAPLLRGRAKTFRKMFEHLDEFDRPVRIFETGCIEDPDNWAGNGCSTILFDKYRETHPGSKVWSVDIEPDKIDQVRRLLPNVDAICDDSVKVMGDYAKHADGPLDLLYLDASHLEWSDPVPSALHHLNELMAVMPALHSRTMVAVDDSPATMDEFPRVEIGGKGELVARYLFSVGADLEFLEYQAGWTNVTAKPSREPETINGLIARARGHVEGDRLVAADSLYRLVLSMTLPPWPRGSARIARGEACAFFAKLSLSRSRIPAAASWFHEALRADPAAIDYRMDLATKCYLPMGMLESAITEAERSVRIDSLSLEAWRTLGALRHENRDVEKAVEALDEAVRLSPPGDAEAALFRATLALDMSDHDLVRDMCAMVGGTRFAADATHVLAMTASRESRHEDAIELFDEAIAGECDDPATAHWHKSLSLEAIGRWPEAWAERARRADARNRPALALPMRRFDKPLWDGQPAPARVHVHAEAGSGDNLCMVRYLPLLVERGYDVCYEGADDMIDLVRQSLPDVEVVSKAADYPGVYGVKQFDYHLPIGQLQHAFRTGLDTVPWSGAYLRADPVRVAHYRAELEDHPSRGKRVGLCWSSGIRLDDSYWLAEYGRRKSMNFETLFRAMNDARHDTQFVSLQVGPERDQLAWPVVDLLPERPSWAETAALVANLDLVITVDTGVAHLAGGMGKPVWVLTQRDGASWHFMCERPGASWNERSPWYPAARVFRQRDLGDWSSVTEAVSRALQEENVLV
jgi:tetratricopeptide (TPR) repeat protein